MAHRTNWAVKVTEENLREIIEFAQNYNRNLSYLKDNMEYNAEDGFDTYVIFSCWSDGRGDATFTEVDEECFDETWRFTDEHHPVIFRGIEKI